MLDRDVISDPVSETDGVEPGLEQECRKLFFVEDPSRNPSVILGRASATHHQPCEGMTHLAGTPVLMFMERSRSRTWGITRAYGGAIPKSA